MSATRQAVAATAPETVPRPRVVRERSVRRGRLGAALALMAVFALGAAALLGYVSRTQPYLAVARDLAVGQQVTATDLVTVHLNPAPGLKAVPAGQRDAVVGKYASVTLMAGTLLAPAALVDKPFPAPGEQVVGMALRAGQMPSAPLRPGARLLLISTADETQDGPPAAAPSVPATVVHVATGSREGTATVSVAVRDGDAPLVARLSAQGRIVVTLLAGG